MFPWDVELSNYKSSGPLSVKAFVLRNSKAAEQMTSSEEKSRIRETLNLSTDVDKSTNTIGGETASRNDIHFLCTFFRVLMPLWEGDIYMLTKSRPKQRLFHWLFHWLDMSLDKSWWLLPKSDFLFKYKCHSFKFVLSYWLIYNV